MIYRTRAVEANRVCKAMDTILKLFPQAARTICKVATSCTPSVHVTREQSCGKRRNTGERDPWEPALIKEVFEV